VWLSLPVACATHSPIDVANAMPTIAPIANVPGASVGRAVRQAWLAMELAKYNGRNDLMLFDSIRDANEDALTNVHSRRYFDMRLQRELTRALVSGKPLSLAMLDIDDFGQINKQYGHPTGDAALVQFARMVVDGVRPSDWLARWGGEEFCLVMFADLAEAVQVAERIREKIECMDISGANGEVLNITVSIGVVQASDTARTVIELVQQASLATRLAKDSGKNRVSRFVDRTHGPAPGVGTERSSTNDRPHDQRRP